MPFTRNGIVFGSVSRSDTDPRATARPQAPVASSPKDEDDVTIGDKSEAKAPEATDTSTAGSEQPPAPETPTEAPKAQAPRKGAGRTTGGFKSALDAPKE